MEAHQIKSLLENPNAINYLADQEKSELILKGILYHLTFDFSEDESLKIIQDYLFTHAEDQITAGLIKILLLKAGSSAEANHLLFEYGLHHPAVLDEIKNHLLFPLDEKQRILVDFYAGKVTHPDHLLTVLTDFFRSAQEPLRLFLIQKAERNQFNHWVIFAKTIQLPQKEFFEELIDQVHHFSKAEKSILLTSYGELAQSNRDFNQVLYLIYNRYLDPQVARKINEINQIPQDPEVYAVYLLLTEQWDKYESFDFDQTYLKSAFLKASTDQRQKILSKSRVSGKFSWLQEISGQKKMKWVSDLNEADWENALQYLFDQNDADGLLKVLNILPPIIAKSVLFYINQKLSEKNQFEFTSDPYWVDLLKSVKNLPQTLPSPEILNQKPTLAKNVLSSTLSTDQKQVFLGLTTNSVLEIELSSFKANLPGKSTTGAQTRALLTDQENKLLILAQGDHQIRFLRLSDNQIIKNLSGHNGLIKKLCLSKDNKTLFSCGFDGKLISWRFPIGTQLQSVQISSAECFDLGLTHNNNTGFVVDSKGFLYTFLPSTLQKINTIQASQTTITTAAASDKQPLVAIYDNSEILSVWNIESAVLLKKKQVSSPITTIKFSDHDDFLICGHLSGKISMISLHDLSEITSIMIHPSPVINLVKLNQNKLCIINRDGTISLINFQLINTLYTPINLIKESIDPAAANKENGFWLNFLNNYYRFIHRYDIIIEDQTTIQLGEFDIQIE